MPRLLAFLFLLFPLAAHAQGIALLDRIVAVVNKEVGALSVLNDTIAQPSTPTCRPSDTSDAVFISYFLSGPIMRRLTTLARIR